MEFSVKGVCGGVCEAASWAFSKVSEFAGWVWSNVVPDLGICDKISKLFQSTVVEKQAAAAAAAPATEEMVAESTLIVHQSQEEFTKRLISKVVKGAETARLLVGITGTGGGLFRRSTPGFRVKT